MEKFDKELEVGEIHERDRWQFELKSDFFPGPSQEKPVYTQEFYLFLPHSLQVNPETYSHSQFYKDQTNFIRHKTPEFTLRQLTDPANSRSPLYRINLYREKTLDEDLKEQISDELKLLGNIVRSSLRKRIGQLIEEMNDPDGSDSFLHDAHLFCEELHQMRRTFLKLQESCSKEWSSSSLLRQFEYVDEFISNAINFYLTGFLERLRQQKGKTTKSLDREICSILTEEYEHRKKRQQEPESDIEDPTENEFVLYRRGLLNKFIVDALLLDINRFSLRKRTRNFTGAFAAGIAMLFYLVFFVLQGEVFVMNSEPFILFTVILYILKDRMKDGLKAMSYRQALKWFPDYTTEIRTPDEKETLGHLKESLSFVSTNNLPKEILQIRNLEFHTLLEAFKRPENVIYYKKDFEILEKPTLRKSRRAGFNTIFRFNIQSFLSKASRPTHPYVTLDPKTQTLKKTQLPKVYHINIILKNTYTDENRKPTVELKKFRLVVDKNGIKRVEHLG